MHIQWNPATDEVEVVNYHAGAYNNLTAYAQVLNMDASVAWEGEAQVNSQEDTTEKCIKLQYPDNLTKVHFIKLTLKEGDRVISENFYHRSKEENNYQDLKQLEKVTLLSDMQYEQDANGEWHAVVTLENTTSTPALMVRLNIGARKTACNSSPSSTRTTTSPCCPARRRKCACIGKTWTRAAMRRSWW